MAIGKWEREQDNSKNGLKNDFSLNNKSKFGLKPSDWYTRVKYTQLFHSTECKKGRKTL